jgi:excisionase family DNA binding protein
VNFIVELPKDSLFISKKDLKEVIKEIIAEGKMEMEDNSIMTIKETADFLKVSIPTVRTLIANKEIPFFQRGQVIRLNRIDLMDWMRINIKGSMN